MTPRTHPIAVLLAAGCALLMGATALASPASARQVTVRDARSDVWAASDTTVATPAPGVRKGDITKAVIRHAGSDATVKIRFKKLNRHGPYAQYSVRLQGRNGRVREVLVETGRGNRSGSNRVFRPGGGLDHGCDARHDVDYRHDRVTVKLDRSCIDKPGSIRANVNTARATGKAVFYSDNVHDAAAESAAWSPWVRRSR